MSNTFGTAGDAQVATGVAGVHWLIELDFASPVGTLRFTTSPVDVPAGGYTYRGLGQSIGVGPVGESEDVSGRQIVISFPLGNTEMLGTLLADVAEYRGRRVRLYLQLLSATFAPVDTRRPRWSGRMEPV